MKDIILFTSGYVLTTKGLLKLRGRYDERVEFLISIPTSLCMSYIIWDIHYKYSYIYHFLYDFLLNNNMMEYLIYTIILLNSFEIFTHILTGLKYLNIKTYEPLGSRNRQTLSIFTTFNVLDIIGWELFLIYFYNFNLIPSLLMAFHYGSGTISLLYNFKMFDIYYTGMIENPHIESEKYWLLFKTGFVFTDAFVSLIYILVLLLNLSAIFFKE